MENTSPQLPLVVLGAGHRGLLTAAQVRRCLEKLLDGLRQVHTLLGEHCRQVRL